MDNILEQLKNQYDVVFDENGNVKPCGRHNCKKMMQILEEVTGIKDIFGNLETGMMNVEIIQKTIKNLF